MHTRNVIFFILIKFILSPLPYLVGCGKQNLRLFKVSFCISFEDQEFQDTWGMLKHRLGVSGPQYHPISMLASTNMSAILSGLWSSVDALHYCVLLVPATKLLQVPASSPLSPFFVAPFILGTQ